MLVNIWNFALAMIVLILLIVFGIYGLYWLAANIDHTESHGRTGFTGCIGIGTTGIIILNVSNKGENLSSNIKDIENLIDSEYRNPVQKKSLNKMIYENFSGKGRKSDNNSLIKKKKLSPFGKQRRPRSSSRKKHKRYKKPHNPFKT